MRVFIELGKLCAILARLMLPNISFQHLNFSEIRLPLCFGSRIRYFNHKAFYWVICFIETYPNQCKLVLQHERNVFLMSLANEEIDIEASAGIMLTSYLALSPLFS